MPRNLSNAKNPKAIIKKNSRGPKEMDVFEIKISSDKLDIFTRLYDERDVRIYMAGVRFACRIAGIKLKVTRGY